MIRIAITEADRLFIDIYAEKQTIGGFSNLSKEDLWKSSRGDFQKTGVGSECAWYKYRYGNYDKLKELLDYKFENLRPQNKGDNGYDDEITANNKTRFVDIKGSHCENEERIKYLNLIIPQREFHKDQIYVCAFTIGKDRRNIDNVILAGWCISEDVHKRWKYDENKFCVPVDDLRDMIELEEYIR